jgi:hypothetical protein
MWSGKMTRLSDAFAAHTMTHVHETYLYAATIAKGRRAQHCPNRGTRRGKFVSVREMCVALLWPRHDMCGRDFRTVHNALTSVEPSQDRSEGFG